VTGPSKRESNNEGERDRHDDCKKRSRLRSLSDWMGPRFSRWCHRQ